LMSADVVVNPCLVTHVAVVCLCSPRFALFFDRPLSAAASVSMPGCRICAKETECEMGPADGSASAPGSALDPESMATPLVWRRSSRCSANSCVEVADLPDGAVAVRDGKQPMSAPALLFSAQEWQAFISGVYAGEFG
jgi:hypothetical protein